MIIEKTDIEGLLVIQPKVHGDERGYFMETYREQTLADYGIEKRYIQDNEAYSKRGTVRGLHYQTYPKGQSKLIRVVTGEVLDVVVDIRPDSKTYGKVFSIILSAENKKQLLVPTGMAHGYSTLSDDAVFLYKCNDYYAPDYEAGIRYDDEKLNIDWMLPKNEMIISEKDQNWPAFGDHTPYK